MKLGLSLLVIWGTFLIAGCSSMNTTEAPAAYQAQEPETTAEAEPEVTIEQPASPLLFAFDSYQLKDDQQAVFEEWLNYLKASKAAEISIHGHADEVGTEVYNYELSKKRAQTIKNLLESQLNHGIKVHVYAYGETMPLVEGEAEISRRFNRRVEIKVSKSAINSVVMAGETTKQ